MMVVEHLEKHLGKIARSSWPEERKYNISVSIFPNQPFERMNTYSTLGLNFYDVGFKSNFELLFVCSDIWNELEISAFLQRVAEYLVSNRKAILRGDIVYLPRTVINGSQMKALYVAIPFYFDDDIQAISDGEKSVVFPLLIPIYEKEAELVETKGWNAFEDFLEDNQVDNLWDLKRKPFSW